MIAAAKLYVKLSRNQRVGLTRGGCDSGEMVWVCAIRILPVAWGYHVLVFYNSFEPRPDPFHYKARAKFEMETIPRS
jgi:hypothetical protein